MITSLLMLALKTGSYIFTHFFGVVMTVGVFLVMPYPYHNFQLTTNQTRNMLLLHKIRPSMEKSAAIPATPVLKIVTNEAAIIPLFWFSSWVVFGAA